VFILTINRRIRELYVTEKAYQKPDVHNAPRCCNVVVRTLLIHRAKFESTWNGMLGIKM
jgi:hypothetical protein